MRDSYAAHEAELGTLPSKEQFVVVCVAVRACPVRDTKEAPQIALSRETGNTRDQRSE
jgi:hypothetical protein